MPKKKYDKQIKQISDFLSIPESEAQKIIEKAEVGSEFSADATSKIIDIDTWLIDRFIPNTVFIDEADYSRMCINALKILHKTAATDYGSSRQRDMGQLWADMTRGYLGEYAFKLLLQSKWEINIKLGHEVGEIAEFLSSDVKWIEDEKGNDREPKLNISIKTSKWNGMWLDIPGDQFSHSDVFVFVKVGTGRDHLFAFFKHISVFKDKILQRGVDVGSLTPDESDQLFENLPSFSPIPAYVVGFVLQNKEYTPLSYSGKMGRKNYTIRSWNGAINPSDLDKIAELENVTGAVKFESIGKFSHDKGYLFNTGNLIWQKNDWVNFIQSI